jgi:molybdate transport system permease protein
VTRTVSIEIFDQVQASNYATANATAVLLLLICFAMLAIVYGMNRKASLLAPIYGQR